MKCFFKYSLGFSLLFLATLSFASVSPDTKVEFHKGSLKSVKERAAQEGKLYFVEFTAVWCMPCQLMDETTFNDPGLAYYISQNYIASKVDIDDFDGIVYKKQFNVKVVPTIMVFSSKGQLLGKYEESFPTTKLMDILKKHDRPQYRTKIELEVPNFEKEKEAEAVEMKTDMEDTTVETETEEKIHRPALGATEEETKVPEVAGSGLYRFYVDKQDSKGFSVQIGVYADYENVLRETFKFREMFKKPILVHIDKLQTRTVYRILVGEFEDVEEATSFTAEVNAKNLEGFVKDLSTLK